MRVDVVPELYEIFIGTVDAIVGDVPLMEITRSTVPRYYAAAKRGIDFVGALFLLIITSPILILAAIAIVAHRRIPAALLPGAQRKEPQAVLGVQAPHDDQGRREAHRPGARRRR